MLLEESHAAESLKLTLSHAWRAHFFIVCIAVVGLCAIAFVGPFSELKFWDEKVYYQLAQNLVEYGVYGQDAGRPDAYRPPGYAFFITPFVWAGGGKQLINVVQILLWALNAYLAGRIVLQLGGPVAAAATVILALAYPIFAYTALTLYPQTLTATLLLALTAILFAVPTASSRSVANLIGLGAMSGVSILVTPPMMLLVGAIAVIAGILRMISIRQIATVLVIAGLTLAPWLIRNWVVLGSPVIATNGGLVLFLGNATKTMRPELGRLSEDSPEVATIMEAAKNLGEVQRDRYFRRLALQWMENHPREAVLNYITKFLHFFGFREEFETATVNSNAAAVVMFISYYPILLLCFINLILAIRWPISRFEVILYISYIAAAGIYALFFTRLRYRAPFDYYLIMIAALAICKPITSSKAGGLMGNRQRRF